jgi:hypothetical protein
VKYAINYLIYIPEYYIHFRSPNKIGLRVLESYLESKIVFRNVTESERIILISKILTWPRLDNDQNANVENFDVT